MGTQSSRQAPGRAVVPSPQPCASAAGPPPFSFLPSSCPVLPSPFAPPLSSKTWVLSLICLLLCLEGAQSLHHAHLVRSHVTDGEAEALEKKRCPAGCTSLIPVSSPKQLHPDPTSPRTGSWPAPAIPIPALSADEGPSHLGVGQWNGPQPVSYLTLRTPGPWED